MRLLILLALIGYAFAAARQSTRIVGGSATTIETYPYMANVRHLYLGVFWMQWCGGALITSRSILSAAHCYGNNPANRYQMRLGANNTNSGGSLYTVERIVLHPEYNSQTEANDVAVVILSNPAVLSASVGRARIAGAHYHLPDGIDVVAIGWGALWSQGPQPEVLQHVTLNIINHQLCRNRYLQLKAQMEAAGNRFPYVVEDGMVCAGILDVGGKDACQGDSGGPLSFRHPDGDVIYGVTSWGVGCADPVYPGVNTRVSSYAEWIVEAGSV